MPLCSPPAARPGVTGLLLLGGRSQMPFRTPEFDELENARAAYQADERRELFYRTATELVDLAIRNQISLSLAEVLTVLLQRWNQPYNRYSRFDAARRADIERLLSEHRDLLHSIRERAIDDFSEADQATVEQLFQDFERILGPVGAARCLHLLAPRFFPLWDRDIASAYLVSLLEPGGNGERYYRFMRIVKEQCVDLGGEQRIGRNPLQALDEYNYCHHTKRWI
jgi:hypothetical protein